MKLPKLTLLLTTLIGMTPASGQVTFNEHIAPLIFNNCTVCHREGEIGPMPLTNYAEVSAFANAIDIVVHEGTMPPWPPDRSFSRFVGERGLTDDQKELIKAWVDADMPEGDPALATDLPNYPEGSVLGEPDLTLTMANAYEITGNGRDEYRVFVLPTGLTEDKDLVAVEFRAGNAEIVHHALISLDDSGRAREIDARNQGEGYPSFGDFGDDLSALDGLAYPGWVPGATPRFFPPGTGLKLPAGSDILLQVHYAPWPSSASDQSSLNLFFADKPVERYIQARLMLPTDLVDSNNEYYELNPLLGALAGPLIAGGINEFLGETITSTDVRNLGQNATLDTVFGDQVGGTVAGFFQFDIPADRKRSFVGKWEISKDISLVGVWPHMHYLGTGWEIVLERPDGTSENLIRIGDWDFNWQGSYTFDRYIHAPKGSRILATAGYDNTSSNFANPNRPPEDVDWGQKTTDEMYFLPFSYVDYQPGDELISLESLSPGDLPTFRVAGLSEETIEFRLQNQENAYYIEHSADMHLWQRVSSTETATDADWKTISIPRTEDSAGFYRAVIFP